MLMFFIFAAIEATQFKELASYFPLYLSLVAIVLMVIEIIRQVINLKKGNEEERAELLHPHIGAALIYSGILILYAVMVYVIGMVLASVIYVFAFLYFIAKTKLWKAILITAILIGAVIGFADLMNLYWPKSLINILTVIFV